MPAIRFVAALAVALSLLVPSAAGAQTNPTLVSIEVSDPVVSYKGKVTVTVKVEGVRSTSGSIRIYETSSEVSHRLVKSGTPTNGVVQVTVQPAVNTSFKAYFSGDETHDAADSEAVDVKVRARFTGSLAGYDSKDGKFHVYRAKLPIFRVRLSPNHAGVPVRMVAQLPQGDGWGTFDTIKVPLNSDSSALATIHMPPGNYRVKAFFSGTGRAMATKTKWFFVRMLAA